MSNFAQTINSMVKSVHLVHVALWFGSCFHHVKQVKMFAMIWMLTLTFKKLIWKPHNLPSRKQLHGVRSLTKDVLNGRRHAWCKVLTLEIKNFNEYKVVHILSWPLKWKNTCKLNSRWWLHVLFVNMMRFLLFMCCNWMSWIKFNLELCAPLNMQNNLDNKPKNINLIIQF